VVAAAFCFEHGDGESGQKLAEWSVPALHVRAGEDVAPPPSGQCHRHLGGVAADEAGHHDGEITALERQRTTGVVRMKATIHNQDSVLVLEGSHAYLVKLPG
jgi:hypothetical protein